MAQLAIQARDLAAAARRKQEALAGEAEAAASVQRKVADELAAVEARAADPGSDLALAAAAALNASPTGMPPTHSPLPLWPWTVCVRSLRMLAVRGMAAVHQLQQILASYLEASEACQARGRQCAIPTTRRSVQAQWTWQRRSAARMPLAWQACG